MSPVANSNSSTNRCAIFGFQWSTSIRQTRFAQAFETQDLESAEENKASEANRE